MATTKANVMHYMLQHGTFRFLNKSLNMHVHAGACMAVLAFHVHMQIPCMMTKHCGWYDDEALWLIDDDFPAKKMAPRKKYFWRENFGGKKVWFTYPRYKSSAGKHDNQETCHVFFPKKFTCHIPMTSSWHNFLIFFFKKFPNFFEKKKFFGKIS